MLFRLTSDSKGTMTHCGVLEFTAEEGSCYIPFWMMQNLLIEEGTVITVTNVSLPKATFVKLQPQHVDFLEVSNPRAVLEYALRNFSCVTKGDVICVPHNNKNYHFELKEVQPQDAACIIETDCNVDFDAPVGYKEPTNLKPPPSSASSSLGGFPESRTSQCPSPTASSASAVSSAPGADDEDSKPRGIRIVEGKIVRPDEDETANKGPSTTMLAERTGGTGVQKNAAIPSKAPEVDYWAVNAGSGARLDGKAPAALMDKDGTEVDIRKLRAEAAARRAAAAQSRMNGNTATMSSMNGNSSNSSNNNNNNGSKRKSRIGSKYGRLKQGGKAFHGSSNSMS